MDRPAAPRGARGHAVEVTGDSDLVALLAAAGLALRDAGRGASGHSAGSPRLPLSWLALAARPGADIALRASSEGFEQRADGVPAVVHVAQRVRLERPLQPGERLTVDTGAVAVRSTPRGLVGRVRTRFLPSGVARAHDDIPVAEVGSRFLITERAVAGAGAATGSADADQRDDMHAAADRGRSWSPDAAVVAAFAALSGDRAPLHLDAAAAGRAGYAGPLVHGLLLFAAAESAAAPMDPATQVPEPSSVGELTLRFEAPVVAGPAELRIEVGPWRAEERARDAAPVRTAPLRLLDAAGRVAASGRVEHPDAAPHQTRS